ncbi:MAG TPA: hypothetical protein VMV81_06395, partial [Phycisphaerae bacterium]|nr:hypothetical protein [Phycisphaerae bacterium]
HIHTDQTWPPENRAVRPARLPFRIVTMFLGGGMLSTVALGIIMAYRLAARTGRITVLILLGLMIPLLVVLLE